MLHAGLETVLSVLQQNLWLTKEDVGLNVSSDVCLARDSESDLANTTMGSLPEERVSTSLPVVHIGTDFGKSVKVKVKV